MTALASVWEFGGCSRHPGSDTETILHAQGTFGSSSVAIRTEGSVALGRAMRPTLPEDVADNQPFFSATRNIALVADVRVDNRVELIEALCDPPRPLISDAELVFRAYQRWGDRFPEHLIGDFAVVVWDRNQQRISLFRDPTGQRPLHFVRSSNRLAVASTAKGLLSLPWVDKTLDFETLALFVGDVPRRGQRTYFKSIQRVEPGHAVFLGSSSTTSHPYWKFPREILRLHRPEDYVDAFREQLDRATAARLRGSELGLGTHLSSGIDSSAVTATAALKVRTGARLVAFTGAPRPGFAGAVPAGRAGDESHPASSLAAMFPNLEHVILRDPLSPLAVLRRDANLYDEPLGLPCNQTWWSAIHDRARDLGIRVMLTGESGNYTISAGGISVLARYLGAGATKSWAHEVTSLRRASFGMPGLLAASFGPWLPHLIWRSAMRYARGPSASEESLSVLKPRYRDHARPLQRFARGERPARNEAVQRWRMMQDQDPGSFRHGVLEHWRLDERDVASDRRLAEFMFSIPPEMLLHDGETRRMARLGLADRIPASTWSCARGYQGADWYERLNRKSLLSEWAFLRQSPSVNEFLDAPAVQKIIESWPDRGFETGPVISKYRLMLLRVLSAAHFAMASSGDGAKLGCSG